MKAPLTAALLIALGTGATPALDAQVDILVSTEWVAERLQDPSLVLLHVGNAESFERGRISGARLMEMAEFAPEVGGLVTEMPDPASLRDVLERAGVASDSRIVVYSASSPPQIAARLYLTLVHFGLSDRASMLDGGLTAWLAEGRPVSTETVAVRRGALPELRAGTDLVVEHDYVAARIADGTAAVVDARDRGFWTGEEHLAMRALRPGRIPGAHSIPFRDMVDEHGRLHPVERLEAIFREAGVEEGKPIIVYCHVGQQASLTGLAAKLLGREMKLYDGSYQDWSHRVDLPVETGG
jgi:thiosulfate/3-mercaptopyruvate sulfurtransferase